MSAQQSIGSFETLRYEDSGEGIGVLELHRPERRNAWTVRMAAELHEALTAIDADADMRVLIITGAGDTFSVGADLGSVNLMTPGGEAIESPRRPLMPSDMQIPVIAAMNGHAAGAGISFAMHCDDLFAVVRADREPGVRAQVRAATACSVVDRRQRAAARAPGGRARRRMGATHRNVRRQGGRDHPDQGARARGRS
jgi:hypothetical protein